MPIYIYIYIGEIVMCHVVEYACSGHYDYASSINFFFFFFLGVAENDVGKLGKNNKSGSAAAASGWWVCVIHVSHGSLCFKGSDDDYDGWRLYRTVHVSS
jgi:hypothetical protein